MQEDDKDKLLSEGLRLMEKKQYHLAMEKIGKSAELGNMEAFVSLGKHIF